jgi:hypothetical protein
MKKSHIKQIIKEVLSEVTKFQTEEGMEVKPYIAQGGNPTRFWGVYEDGNLLTVSVYRKGAENVAKRIVELKKLSRNVIDDSRV